MVRLIALAIMVLLMYLALRKTRIVPTSWSGRRGARPRLSFGFRIADQILGEQLGGASTCRCLRRCSSRSLAMNLTGIIPFANIAGTSLVGMPLVLALVSYVAFIYAGFPLRSAGSRSCATPSSLPASPPVLYLLLAPVEIINIFIMRPDLSLALRLLLNMMVGHLLLVLAFALDELLLRQRAGPPLPPSGALTLFGGIVITLFRAAHRRYCRPTSSHFSPRSTSSSPRPNTTDPEHRRRRRRETPLEGKTRGLYNPRADHRQHRHRTATASQPSAPASVSASWRARPSKAMARQPRDGRSSAGDDVPRLSPSPSSSPSSGRRDLLHFSKLGHRHAGEFDHEAWSKSVLAPRPTTSSGRRFRSPSSWRSSSSGPCPDSRRSSMSEPSSLRAASRRRRPRRPRPPRSSSSNKTRCSPRARAEAAKISRAGPSRRGRDPGGAQGAGERPRRLASLPTPNGADRGRAAGGTRVTALGGRLARDRPCERRHRGEPV